MKKSLWLLTGAAIFLGACVNSGSGELAQVSVASRGSDVEFEPAQTRRTGSVIYAH